MSEEGSAPERLLDLMIKRALEGVNLDEARELTVLSRAHPEVSADDIEHVIAVLDAAPLGEERPLPDSVGRIVATRLAATVTTLPAAPPPPPSKLPWMAFAAALLLALGGWWNVFFTDRPVTRTASTPTPAASRNLNNEPGERERIDSDATALSVAWNRPAADAAAIVGAVHWSDLHQLGYMELDGLFVNDPLVEQYQLWIFDASRSADHPVDGGVFDITRSGMQRVPIRATLGVRQPTAFAVTVEAPGGVMVSARERIVALAQVPSN